MRHLDQETLADMALGESAPLTRRDRLHLQVCRRCAAELNDLRAIVATGRLGLPSELRPPRPAVLSLIQAELTVDDAAAAAAPSSATVPGSSTSDLTSRPAASPRVRRLTTAAIAAVALVAVSAGGVIWYRYAAPAEVVVLARATLQPLPDKSGAGTAELIRLDGVEELRVDARAEGVRTGFEELWLINTDGQRMISLGVLPPNGQATYPVPVTAGGGLNGYTIVDISLEPYDGNVAHSKDSLLRGSLS